MSGRPSWKSAEIGLFRPFSAFFARFRRARTAPGKSRKRRKKAHFLGFPPISLNPHLLNPHLRHSNFGRFHSSNNRKKAFSGGTAQGGAAKVLSWTLVRRNVALRVRNGQSTVGGPKWTKMDLFRPKWTKMDHFGPFWSREC